MLAGSRSGSAGDRDRARAAAAGARGPRVGPGTAPPRSAQPGPARPGGSACAHGRHRGQGRLRRADARRSHVREGNKSQERPRGRGSGAGPRSGTHHPPPATAPPPLTPGSPGGLTASAANPRGAGAERPPGPPAAPSGALIVLGMCEVKNKPFLFSAPLGP